MDADDVVDELTDFGLSEKEALAYVTILQNGSTRTRVVSEEADISKSYTYDIVEKLANRELIQIDDHVVPTQLRAVPPSEGIANLVGRLHTIESELESFFDSENYERQRFRIIKSRQTILTSLTDLIDDAESEIALSLPASALNKVEGSLRRAQERDVFCVLLVTEHDGEVPIDDDIADVIQTWSPPAPLTLVVDLSEGIAASERAVLNSNSDKYAIYHAEERIASILSDSFIANYWPMGEQIYVDDPSPLPKTYDSFRHVVFDATLHLRAGQELPVEIEARPTHTREPYETIRGTVVDTVQSLVRPYSEGFSGKLSMVVDTGNERLTVGGPGAFIEEYEANIVTLEPTSDP
ncbi:TrmB family transcriptional regulator [Halobacterium noricense]|uniref:TrmB family transcriptional regulator n=1 Tax=Halobacterium noricense TaxID=223182 RepID=UPI001E3CC07B|nr:TrmB family transcriptional regulator [Halobacterium noricense]UHH27182.1 TrmB family transcriptional regulator [Halobacterium noricense]